MAEQEDSFLSRWSRRKAVARTGVALPEPATAVAVTVEATATSLEARPLPAAPVVSSTAPGRVEKPAAQAEQAPVEAAAPQAPPPPTLADVAALTRDSDYSRFMAGNVTPEVKNAALKHLFTDPHFNVMDGLDTYIGDYNTPDPLPPGMLRQMVQSQLLGIFDDEKEEPTAIQAPQVAVADVPPADALPEDSHTATTTGTAEAPPQTSQGPAPALSDEDADLQLQPDDGAGRPAAEPGLVPDAGRPH